MARNQTASKRHNGAQAITKGSKLEDLMSKPIEYVECRAYRFHAWKTVENFRWQEGRKRGTCRVSACMRCGMGRDDYLDSQFALVYRVYDPPPGYGLEGDGPVVTMYDAMREVMRRSTIAARRSEKPNAEVIQMAERRLAEAR